MVSTTSIRILGPADVGAFRAMLALFGVAFEDVETYCQNQPDDEYVRQWLINPNNLAVVAEFEGSVIGGLAGYVLQKFEQARSGACPEFCVRGIA